MAFVGLVSHGPAAHGADTTEPFDEGAVDIEQFTGVEGLGLGQVELDLDAEPDLARLGLYARAAESLATREEPLEGASARASSSGSASDPAPCATVLAPTTVVSLGAYWTMGEGQQLLLQADACAGHRSAEDEPRFDFRGVALGYNVAVHETIELISQVFVDVPMREGEQVSAGLSLGPSGTAQVVAPDEESAELIATGRRATGAYGLAARRWPRSTDVSAVARRCLTHP